MGKIKQGILGGFSGKVGPVIGSSWKGKAVMKAVALSYNDRNSEAQQQQRAKFALIGKLLSKINGFINFGFAKKAVGITAPNAAMRANLDEAISGTWPNYNVDYSKVAVSAGNVDLPYNATATASGTDLSVSWADNSGRGNAQADDQAMILVFNTDKNEASYTTAAATRTTRAATLTLPSAWGGDNVEVYLAMRRESTGDTSASAYLGNFTL